MRSTASSFIPILKPCLVGEIWKKKRKAFILAKQFIYLFIYTQAQNLEPKGKRFFALDRQHR